MGADYRGIAVDLRSFRPNRTRGIGPEELEVHILGRGNRTKYSYDAFGRRWAKVWPTNNLRDEYFRHYDGTILEDFGINSLSTATPYPIYDYVWLDGKPIATIRSTLSADMLTRTDAASSTFTRQWPEGTESVNCGTYVSFFDHIGRPFLTFQTSASTAAASVAWEGDWDPEGHVNRVQSWQETAHPYSNSSDAGVGSYNQPGAQWFRVHFDGLDTEDCHDHGYVHDPFGNAQFCQKACRTCSALQMTYSGNNGGFWTCQSPMYDGGFGITLNSDTSNWCRVNNNQSCSCNCDGGCSCGNCATTPYDGIVVAEYEYGYTPAPSSGAIPEARPRYHLPGQYWDSESDFHENGGRYYDALSSRYLTTEPMLSDPSQVVSYAVQGIQLNPYAYAANNPLYFIDDDGNGPRKPQPTRKHCPAPAGDKVQVPELTIPCQGTVEIPCAPSNYDKMDAAHKCDFCFSFAANTPCREAVEQNCRTVLHCGDRKPPGNVCGPTPPGGTPT